MTYVSKKDTWLVLVIGVATVAVLAVALVLFVGGTLPDRLLALVILASAVVPLLLVFPVRYAIEDGLLRVRSGLLRWTIPLADVVEVRPTREATSGPALSLDRLRVVYERDGGRTYLLISPERTSAFLDELAAEAPGLKLDGEGVSRGEEAGTV